MTRLTFHLMPHTHWDREWYLPRAAFQARLVPMLDHLLDLLERQPDARFVLDGQTILLEDYLAVRPDRAERLAAQVRRGALEIGPWYVLADELIPSAASLRRNLTEGARDAARFGRRMGVLYGPDAFGHPGELPLLAREAGLEYAVAWRGVGPSGSADRDLYHWEAAGAAVLLYRLPRPGYEIGAQLADEAGLATRWGPIRRDLVARAVTSHVAVFLGADHHAAPADLVAIRDRLRALEPEHEVRLSGLGEFFASAAPLAGGAPRLRGELRRADGHTWVLQGVHGTRARMKRRFSRAELWLGRIAETLAAKAGADDDELVRHAWRMLLQCQFHDTLCGTCSDEVAREQEVRLEAVEAFSREIAARSLEALAGHDADRARATPSAWSPRLVLWNPADRPRGGILTARLTGFRRDVPVGPPSGRTVRTGAGLSRVVLETADGRTLPVQTLEVRAGMERFDAPRHYPDQDEVDQVWVAFRTPDVAAGAVMPLRLREPETPGARLPAATGTLDVLGDTMRNALLTAKVSNRGTITLDDLRTGERYEGLGCIESEPDRGDCYTFSAGSGRRPGTGGGGTTRIVSRGPLVGAIECVRQVPAAGPGRVDVRLLAVLRDESPVLRLRLDIDNRAVDHRLRLRMPVGVRGAALAGTALGTVTRAARSPGREQGNLEQEVATAPAHRFVAAAVGSRGLALFAPGFFEYEWTPGGDLLVTLLRAVGQLSREDLPERPGHAAWPTATPEAQEPGRHIVELALAPCDAAMLRRPEQLERIWEDEFLPVQAAFLRNFTPRA